MPVRKRKFRLKNPNKKTQNPGTPLSIGPVCAHAENAQSSSMAHRMSPSSSQLMASVMAKSGVRVLERLSGRGGRAARTDTHRPSRSASSPPGLRMGGKGSRRRRAEWGVSGSSVERGSGEGAAMGAGAGEGEGEGAHVSGTLGSGRKEERLGETCGDVVVEEVVEATDEVDPRRRLMRSGAVGRGLG